MMAPTRGQRRAVILLLLLSVVLITLDHRGEALPRRPQRRALRGRPGPARGRPRWSRPVGRFFGGLGDLGDSGRKIDALQKENAELRRQLRRGRAVDAPARHELQKLKLLSGQGGFTGAARGGRPGSARRSASSGRSPWTPAAGTACRRTRP